MLHLARPTEARSETRRWQEFGNWLVRKHSRIRQLFLLFVSLYTTLLLETSESGQGLSTSHLPAKLEGVTHRVMEAFLTQKHLRHWRPTFPENATLDFQNGCLTVTYDSVEGDCKVLFLLCAIVRIQLQRV